PAYSLKQQPGGRPERAAAPGTHRSGQGEIRTLDTGLTGMPVFETGAFNHSATCPGQPWILDRRRRRVNELPSPSEESAEQFTALRGAHTGEHLRPMIELRMP